MILCLALFFLFSIACSKKKKTCSSRMFVSLMLKPQQKEEYNQVDVRFSKSSRNIY